MELKKILIYRNCSLGDFIVSLPAIKMIKDLNPNSKIYYATGIKEDTGFITPNLIPLQKGIIDKYIFFKFKPISLIKFLYKIRLIKFDELYYLNEFVSDKKNKRDFIIFNLLKIKKKYGFKIEKYNYKLFNETYYLCRRINNKVKKINISFSNLIQISNKRQKKIITISTGGRHHKKKWDVKYWKILIRLVLKNFPSFSIIILGSKNEIITAKIIQKINKNKITNMCGKTSVKELFNIIETSTYHISHDDGTMHVASCFKKKGVAIFGKISEEGRWYPTNINQKIFFPKNNVNDIKPTTVFRSISSQLRNLK